jgi:hypothetical protein
MLSRTARSYTGVILAVMECSLDPLCYGAEEPAFFGEEAEVSIELALFCEADTYTAEPRLPGTHEYHQTHAASPDAKFRLVDSGCEETCEDPETLVFGTLSTLDQRGNRDNDQGHASSSSFVTSDECGKTSPLGQNSKRASSTFDHMGAEKLVDDKKRRNCIAARECREKKKRTFQALQQDQRNLEARCSQLQSENESLKSQLYFFQVCVHLCILISWIKTNRWMDHTILRSSWFFVSVCRADL